MDIPEIPVDENVKEEISKILKIENATERAITYMLYGKGIIHGIQYL